MRDTESGKQDATSLNNRTPANEHAASSGDPGSGPLLPVRIQEHLALALHPSGRRADEDARQQAIEWLVTHSGEVHPYLLEWLRREPEGPYALAILDLLPAFAEPGAVPVLREALFSSDEYVSEIAGKALGRHPAPAAEAALAEAVASPIPHVVAAAADGFLVRGSRSACQPLLAVLATPDPIARYHVIQAAFRLGCLSQQQLAGVASNDQDPDIRRLAAGAEASGQRTSGSPSDAGGEGVK